MSGKCSKARFKGVENFLRRIAFNLGNSPSQTEVKIISCIPIDVTDLQHRILELEKELEGHHSGGVSPPPVSPPPAEPEKSHDPVVNTALQAPTRYSHGVEEPSSSQNAHTANCPSSSIASWVHRSPRKSAVGFVRSETECMCVAVDNERIYKPEPSPRLDRKPETQRRGLFKKVKKKVKDKNHTHFVYYAQPYYSSPFNSPRAEQSPTPRLRRKSPPKEPISRFYVEEVARKFKPQHVDVNLSGSSHFSAPVCRDEISDTRTQVEPNASAELCSCCHIAFHDVDTLRPDGYVNVDRHMPAPIIQNGFLDVDRQRHRSHDTVPYIEDRPDPRRNIDHSAFYDSSLYDVVPVRETPHRIINDDIRNTKRMQSRMQPYTAVYNSSPPAKVRQISPPKVPQVHEPVRRLLKRKTDRIITGAVAQTSSVNFSNVYTKPVILKSRGQKIPELPTKIVVQKNAECLTINVTNTECQTADSKSVQLDPPPPVGEGRTEVTLNQIKSILQSVLTEVKESAQPCEPPHPAPPPPPVDTRDAVVQNGASRGDMAACSSFLNSISFSPYHNYLNPYTPSRLLPPAMPVYPKCLQNYPLFIHTTGKKCACCFRNVPSRAAAPPPRRAQVAATNTEATHTTPRSNETKTLIKEIYKSIAVDMVYPQRATSNSEGGDMHSLRSSRRPSYSTSKGTSSGIYSSSSARADAAVNTSTRLYPRSQFGSQVISNSASMRSPLVSRTTTSTNRSTPRPLPRSTLRGAPLIELRESRQSSESAEPPQRIILSLSEESEPSTSQDSNATLVSTATQPQKKTGLFTKITRLFRPKSKKDKQKQRESDDDDEAESNSDDYQTVYSQRSGRIAQRQTVDRQMLDRQAVERQKAQRYRTHQYRPDWQVAQRQRQRRTHSKISSSRHASRGERRRASNLEQEHRRHWNERLMFHSGDSPRYTSAVPFSLEASRSRSRPVYYQQYDSRPVIVQETDTNERRHRPQSNARTKTMPRNAGATQKTEVRETISSKGLSWLYKGKEKVACCGHKWKDLIIDG